MGLCYIMDGEYAKAAKMLEDLSFLADNIMQNPLEKIMLKAVYYYASAMDKLHEHEKAIYYIKILFDEEITNCIDESFKDKENIFINHYGITPDDYVDNDDDFYMAFMKKIREAQRDNRINQMDNSKIFE